MSFEKKYTAGVKIGDEWIELVSKSWVVQQIKEKFTDLRMSWLPSDVSPNQCCKDTTRELVNHMEKELLERLEQ